MKTMLQLATSLKLIFRQQPNYEVAVQMASQVQVPRLLWCLGLLPLLFKPSKSSLALYLRVHTLG